MTLSESMALDAIVDLDFESCDKKALVHDLGFVLTVARDNYNWSLVDDLLDKAFEFIRGK